MSNENSFYHELQQKIAQCQQDLQPRKQQTKCTELRKSTCSNYAKQEALQVSGDTEIIQNMTEKSKSMKHTQVFQIIQFWCLSEAFQKFALISCNKMAAKAVDKKHPIKFQNHVNMC